MTEQTKIILDCDPGNDDAINILLALSSPRLNLLGITTVFGNVDVEKTTNNANTVCTLVNRKVPLYRGASEPMVLPRIDAAEVHGKTGMAGSNLPKPALVVEDKHAVDFIIESVKTHPNEVILVPTGALTNIALALKLAPEIAHLIKEIVLMGGSTTFGNRTPAAEFNILADPHAARVVFESATPVTMFGLNVTHQALTTQAVIDRFYALNTTVGNFVAEIFEHYNQFYQQYYALPGGALHDPMTVAYLLKPQLFQFQNMNVQVDCQDGINQGRTVCDVWNKSPGKLTKVATQVNPTEFFNLLVKQISIFN